MFLAVSPVKTACTYMSVLCVTGNGRICSSSCQPTSVIRILLQMLCMQNSKSGLVRVFAMQTLQHSQPSRRERSKSSKRQVRNGPSRLGGLADLLLGACPRTRGSSFSLLWLHLTLQPPLSSFFWPTMTMQH